MSFLRQGTFTLLLPVLLSVLVFFSSPVLAEFDDSFCPPADEIVQSPFRPYFYYFKESNQQCWYFADCLFNLAAETRKQQWAATALVMGLIPLTLKDIAWPERRVIPVSKKPNTFVLIIVLALGLVPVEYPIKGSDDKKDLVKAREKSTSSSWFSEWAWNLRKTPIVILNIVFLLALGVSYTALALIEIYSKRAAVGCPYPICAVTWYIGGLIPATIHTFFSWIRQKTLTALKKRQAERHGQPLIRDDGEQGHYSHEQNAFKAGHYENSTPAKREAKGQDGISIIQGEDEWWPVQLAWAIYYIAGTLIFTSIMAVTVIELTAWVIVTIIITGAGKMFAFFLCLALEDTGPDTKDKI